MKLGRTWALASFAVIATASPAMATVHTDPCPGQHIQVWSEVGNSGAGQATNHFVCGPLRGEPGKDGADGKDGKDGEMGPQGPAGEPGLPGKDGADSTVPGPQGERGEPGKDGIDGKDGAVGPRGEPGPATSSTGARGPAGKDGKDGVTKTIYVTRIIHEDGTVTEEPVASLPHTGGDAGTWLLAAAGICLVGVGTGVTYVWRRRKH